LNLLVKDAGGLFSAINTNIMLILKEAEKLLLVLLNVSPEPEVTVV
jgi:hypothetical protein